MALPELTPEQLLERCDLAGVARVVGIDRASPDSPNLVKLLFVRVTKGALRDSSGFVYVRLHGGGALSTESELASWSDWWDYPIGADVVTHLDWNGPEELYQTTWPGAVIEIEHGRQVA